MTKNWEYGKRWDQTYRLTFINSPRLKTSRDLLLSFVNPSLWNASRITFCTGKCQNALADGRILLYSYRMDPSLAKSITYVQMKLSSRGAKKSKVAFLLDRVDPVVVSPVKKKEDESRNETRWIDREEWKIGGIEWVGERTLTLNARWRKQGLDGRSVEGTGALQDVPFPLIPYSPPRSSKRLLLFLRFPRFFLTAFARLV